MKNDVLDLSLEIVYDGIAYDDETDVKESGESGSSIIHVDNAYQCHCTINKC